MLRSLPFFIFYLLSLAFHLNAQTKVIAGLKREVETATTDDKRLEALFALCEEKQSLNTDTFCKYASVAKEISFHQKNKANIAMAEYYIASCLVKRSALDTALQICEKNIREVKNDPGALSAVMKLTALKAQIFIRSTRYKEGLAEIYKVLHTAEGARDTMMQIVALNGIGWVNMEMDQGQEALTWFFKALKVTDNNYYHEKNSNIYSNIAAIYKGLGKHDSAEYFVEKAIAFSRKTGNLFFLANSLNILADIYIDTQRPVLAEAPLNEALKIRKEIGDPFYIVSDISQLAIYYAHILQPAKGIAISREGIEIAKKYKITAKLSYLYHALGENYKAAGNYVEYSKTLEQIMTLKDSVYAANTAEAKAEMYTRYNLDKKENLIKVQSLELANKNYLIYGSLALLVLTLFTSWLLFRGFKKNQQIKLLKMQTEEKKLAAHAVMSAEEKERKRISRDLHDNIGAYATALMANTEQLKQQAAGNVIKQSADNVSENAHDIMNSLQETIWVLNNDVITITDFIDRFKLYSKKMLQNFPGIQIRFKEQLDNDIELSPAEALHLFRIMQETLQNTVKHAKPRNLCVTVETNESIFISIKDDGKGFNTLDVSSGNGLLNMRHRAKEAGYRFNITSAEEGTEITLQKNNAFAV